jgi:hypothetical protein
VIRDPAQENQLVDWRVLLVGERFGHNKFEVFASLADVTTWAESIADAPDDLVARLRTFFDNPSHEGVEHVDRANAYRVLAEQKRLRSEYCLLAQVEERPLCSKELFDIAIDRGVISSLVVFDATETSLEPIVDYCPRLPTDFVAARATCDRTYTLYDYTYPQERSQQGGKAQEIYQGGTRVPIGFVTRAAKSGRA